MTTKRKPQQVWYRSDTARRALRLTGVLFIIVILMLTTLPITNTTNLPQNTPTQTQAGARPFPTVPPGGTPVIVGGVYVHPSGVFALPQILGWDKPIDSPEETTLPGADSTITRAGTTFINSNAASVIHAFAEKDTAREKIADSEALSKYYTSERIRDAWAKYTGGWNETGRRFEGDSLVIDFSLHFEEQVYFGRQISRQEGDWLMVLRLVAPDNNLPLLDQLQATLAPTFRLVPEALNVPMSWVTLSDSGYMIRFPPDWVRIDGAPGRAYTITGTRGQDNITLITRSITALTIQDTPDAAKSWLMASRPKAVIQTIIPDKRGNVPGYSISYIDVDADGNRRSSLVTVLVGTNNTLYTATIQLAKGELDLLKLEGDKANALAELAQVRGTFIFSPILLPPGGNIVPALTPTPTDVG